MSSNKKEKVSAIIFFFQFFLKKSLYLLSQVNTARDTKPTNPTPKPSSAAPKAPLLSNPPRVEEVAPSPPKKVAPPPPARQKITGPSHPVKVTPVASPIVEKKLPTPANEDLLTDW